MSGAAGAPQQAPGDAEDSKASGEGDNSGSEETGTEYGAETAPSAEERQVARTASMTLVIADPADAAKQVRQAAQKQGGYLLSESIVTEQRDGLYVRPSTVVVAVPGATLDASLETFATLGDATYRAVTATDVTTQIVDLDARIKVLRASISRVEKLMDKAGSISEVARVEAELTTRQQDLESMVAKQRALADRVAMAPVTITLRTSASMTVAPNPLWQGLEAGLNALVASVRVLIVLIGMIAPFAVVGLLVGWPLWRLRRARRAGAGAKNAKTAEAASEEPTAAEESTLADAVSTADDRPNEAD